MTFFLRYATKASKLERRSRATTTFTRPKGLTRANGFLLAQRASNAAQLLIPYGNWRWT